MEDKILQMYNWILYRKSRGCDESTLLKSDSNPWTLIKLIHYILNKSHRSPNEITILQLFLGQIRTIREILINDKAYHQIREELLTTIATNLRYEFHSNGKIIFRYGEKGDKYSIILYGKVDVIIPGEETAHLNSINYLKYLFQLYVFNEMELFIKVINANKDTYRFSELDVKQWINIYELLYEINNLHEENDYYWNLRKKWTEDKYVNLRNRREIENIIINKMHDSKVIEYWSKNDFFQWNKWFYELINKVVEIIESNNTKQFRGDSGMNKQEEREVSSSKQWVRDDDDNNKNKNCNKVNVDDYAGKSCNGLAKEGQHEHDWNNQGKPQDCGARRESIKIPATVNVPKLAQQVFKAGKRNKNSTIPIITNITTDQYVSTLNNWCDSSQSFAPLVKVYKYQHATSLGAGFDFGDVALHNLTNQKRNATIIISSDECHLGIWTKSTYDFCLKNAKIKNRFQAMSFFLNIQWFKDINPWVFEDKIFNNFVHCYYKRGSFFFKRGDILEKISLIKSGEVEIYANWTWDEWNNEIKSFGWKGDPDWSKWYHAKTKKFHLKICKLEKNEIIGIESYWNSTTQDYFCECIAWSAEVEVYNLNKAFFKIWKDPTVWHNMEEYVKQKKEIIWNRLITLYNSIKQNIQQSNVNNTLPQSSSSSSLKYNRKKLLVLQEPYHIQMLRQINMKSSCLNTNTDKTKINYYRKKNSILMEAPAMSSFSKQSFLQNLTNTNDISSVNFTSRSSEKVHIRDKILSLSNATSPRKDTNYSNLNTFSNKEINFKDYIKPTITVNKSVRSKKWIWNKMICRNIRFKSKTNILNETKIKYFSTNPNHPESNNCVHYSHKQETKFRKWLSNTEQTPEKDKKFVDVLMIDKWNERQVNMKTKSLLNSTKVSKYKPKWLGIKK